MRVGAIQSVVLLLLLLLQCVKRVYDLQAAANVGLSAAAQTRDTETRCLVTKALEYNLFKQVIKRVLLLSGTGYGNEYREESKVLEPGPHLRVTLLTVS